jgi:NADH-quinone oxidoreductase subunit L
MEHYTWLIPLLPLLGLPINGILGRKLPRWFISITACLLVGLSFVLSVVLLFNTQGSLPQEIIIYKWINAGSLSIDVGFQLDALSLIMILVVSGVSFLIHIYSVGYMHDDPGYARYFAYLNLFTFSMLLLVLSNNFLMMFVGWEGVGLCSYLLIGFWYEKKSASDAGKKAFIVNKIGDFGFILGIILIFWTFGTINIPQVMYMAPAHFHAGSGLITAITLLLFMGAIGKSAQIPLYVWLPDAMEGPTPVSALIHAATMVTAGVYMIARCGALYMLAPATMILVAIIGALTAIFAASIALVQNDIKKALAYSTISQLGYMFLACGVGAFAVGIFHLMTHAFFKALLFMAAGSVIHAVAGQMDIRGMGGLRRYMPFTFLTFLSAALAISGIYPFAGFFSKDEILLHTFQHNKILWLIGIFTAGMTAFYIFRLVFVTFFGKYRAKEPSKSHLHESPAIMTLPLVALGILSIIGGWPGISSHIPLLGRISFFTEKANFFRFVETAVYHSSAPVEHQSHMLSNLLALLSLIIAASGIFIAYLFYIKNPKLPKRLAQRFKTAYDLLLNKYWVDEIYEFLFIKSTKRLALFLWQSFDDMVIDRIVNLVAQITVITSRVSQLFDEQVIDRIVNTTGWIFQLGSRIFRKLQTGYAQSYLLLFLIGIILLIWYLV